MQEGTGTVKLRATVPNRERRFWPGRFVKVRLVLGHDCRRGAGAGGAPQTSAKGPFVYVVKEDGTAELRPVTLGQRQGDLVIVSAGVKAGERVVINGQIGVTPGRQGPRRRARAGPATPAEPAAGRPQAMNLSEPFIRRPVMTAVLTVSVILFGVLSYRQLPVNDLPAVDYPVIQVQADYPGASPETMANNIATPLERQFMQITGLEIVTSQEHPGPRRA